MEFFVHPWYMAAGGALISSPILIHLINRMRFKRVRWAAMEFLLKSQKRNRRRLIIEQMILLLLRILLVLLAAFLVARFLFAGTGTKGATHVVIVDDTMSMGDHGKDTGKETTAYATALEQVKQIARSASLAASNQQMRIFLLSELDKAPVYDRRLSNQSVDEIDRAFVTRARKATLLSASPLEGLTKARAWLSEDRDHQRILHFVSDFRDKDWAAGAESDKLLDAVKGALEDGIAVNLIDVAAPHRASGSKVANHHSNLAVIDLKPETRVAIEDTAVEFEATVMNYGVTEGRCFLKVYVNGSEVLAGDQILEKLPPGKETVHKFSLTFPRQARAGTEITDKDSAEEREKKRRMEREFNNVRVTITPPGGSSEPEGLNADNVRDLVIEVRRKVPTLVVDGNKAENRGKEDGNGGMDHLSAFYKASAVYDIEERKLQDLEKADLDLYPSIILLNVAELPNDKVLAKLKAYVEGGGSLCYFMGEEVKSDYYNTKLFAAGLFPLKIGERPHDPLAAAGFSDPESRKQERDRLRQKDPQPKILFRDPSHPIIRPLAPFLAGYRYLSINVYWQARPRGEWNPDGRQAEEVIVLPNASSIDKYKARARGLAEEALKRTKQLAEKEAEFKKYENPVEGYRIKVRNALASGDLFQLAGALDALLKDAGVKDDPERPDMPGLWKPESMRGLAAEIKEFRDTVLFGDPLVVSRRSGKGRVVAFLTSAGTMPRRGVGGEDQVQWNNWGAGEKIVSGTYPLFLLYLQRYLVAEGQAPNRVVGEGVELSFDPARYESKVSWTFLPQPDLDSEVAAKPVEEPGKDDMTLAGKALLFHFKDNRRPGVFRMNFILKGDGAEEDRLERRAIAFNVPATAEGDLKRVGRDRLDISAKDRSGKTVTAVLRAPGDNYETLKERQPDASESPWLYLFFIVILVVEQAMAVHLSFHLKGSEAGPAAVPQAAAA